MKKITLGLIGLSIACCATLSAAETTRGITFGASSFDLSNGVTSLNEAVMPESGTQYDLGISIADVTDNNVYMGLDSVITYAKFSAAKVWGLDANFKLGYQPLKGLSGYAIGSLCIDYLNGDTNEDGFGWGYGYGFGTEYQFSQHFAANIEWKKKAINMKSNIVDYDYDYKTVGLNLKYLF